MTDMHVVEDFEFSFCKERADDAIEVLKNSRGGLDGYNIAQYIGQFSNCRGWNRLSSSVRTTQIDELNKLARDYTESSLKSALDYQVTNISKTVDVLQAFCDSNPDLIVSVKSNFFADVAMGYLNLVEGFWKGAESLFDGVLTAASLLVGWIPGVGDVLDAVIEFDIVGNTFDLLYEYHPAFKLIEKYSSWNHDDPSPAKLIKGAGTMIFYIAAAAATGGALAGAGVAGGAMTGLAGALGDGIITFVGTLGQNTEDALIADTTGELSAFKAGWQNVDDALIAGGIAFGAGYILDGVSDYAGKQLKGLFSKAGTKAGSEAGQEALERITSDGLQEVFTANGDDVIATVIKNANGDNIIMDVAGEKLAGQAAEMTAEEFAEKAAQAGMSPEKFAQTLMDNGFDVTTEVLGTNGAGEIVTKEVLGNGFVDATGNTVTNSIDNMLTGNVDNVVTGNVDNVVTGNVDNVVTGNADNIVTGNADNIVTGNADNVITGNADNVVTGNADNVLSNNVDNGFTRNMDDAFVDSLDDSFADNVDNVIDGGTGGSSAPQGPTNNFRLTDGGQQMMGEGLENMTQKGLKAGTQDGLANLENKSLQNLADQGRHLAPDADGAVNDIVSGNADELSGALDDYQKLLDQRQNVYDQLTDLGGKQGNAPTDEFMKLRNQLDEIDNLIEESGKRIEDLSTPKGGPGTDLVPTGGADDLLPTGGADDMLPGPKGPGTDLVPYKPGELIPSGGGVVDDLVPTGGVIDDLVPPVKPDVPALPGGGGKPHILAHSAAIVTGNVVNNEIQPDPTLPPEDLDKVIPTATTPEPTGNTPTPPQTPPKDPPKVPPTETPPTETPPKGPERTEPRVEHTTPPPPAITTPVPTEPTPTPEETPKPTTVVTTTVPTTTEPTTDPNNEDTKVKYCPKCHYPLPQCICGTGPGFINEIIPDKPGDDDSLLSQVAGTKPGLEEIIDNTSGVNIPRSASPIKSSVNAKDNNMIPLMAGLGAAALAGLGTKVYLDRKENKDNEEELEAEEWDETEEEFEALENENYDLDLEESDYLTPNDEFAYQPDGVIAAVADDDEDEDDGEVYEAVNSSELSSMN